jgi:hypothetical protein
MNLVGGKLLYEFVYQFGGWETLGADRTHARVQVQSP